MFLFKRRGVFALFYKFIYVFSFFFFFFAKLFLDQGIKLMPPAMEAWSLHHWTTREIPFAMFLQLKGTSRVAQTVKNLPAMWETGVRCLGRDDLLEKGMATHSRILAWIIPWQRSLAGKGSKRDTTKRLTVSLLSLQVKIDMETNFFKKQQISTGRMTILKSAFCNL